MALLITVHTAPERMLEAFSFEEQQTRPKRIWIEIFEGDGSGTGKMLLRGDTTSFLRGKVDEFQMKPERMVDEDKIDRVELTSESSSGFGLWCLEGITVTTDRLDSQPVVFGCHMWMMGKTRVVLHRAKLLRYRIVVFTGEAPRCGTNNEVYVTLVGENGVNDPRLLLTAGRESSLGFHRGKSVATSIYATHELGKIEQVVVQQVCRGGGGTTRRWLLDRVAVWGYEWGEDEVAVIFPCKRWIGSEPMTLKPTIMNEYSIVIRSAMLIQGWNRLHASVSAECPGKKSNVSIFKSEIIGLPRHTDFHGMIREDSFSIHAADASHPKPLTTLHISFRQQLSSQSQESSLPWWLDSVKVYNASNAMSALFQGFQWIFPNNREEVSVSLQPMEGYIYEVIVKSGDIRGRAPVSVELLLKNVASEEPLNSGKLVNSITSSQESFSTNAASVFFFSAKWCPIHVDSIEVHVNFPESSEGEADMWYCQNIAIVCHDALQWPNSAAPINNFTFQMDTWFTPWLSSNTFYSGLKQSYLVFLHVKDRTKWNESAIPLTTDIVQSDGISYRSSTVFVPLYKATNKLQCYKSAQEAIVSFPILVKAGKSIEMCSLMLSSDSPLSRDLGHEVVNFVAVCPMDDTYNQRQNNNTNNNSISQRSASSSNVVVFSCGSSLLHISNMDSGCIKLFPSHSGLLYALDLDCSQPTGSDTCTFEITLLGSSNSYSKTVEVGENISQSCPYRYILNPKHELGRLQRIMVTMRKAEICRVFVSRFVVTELYRDGQSLSSPVEFPYGSWMDVNCSQVVVVASAIWEDWTLKISTSDSAYSGCKDIAVVWVQLKASSGECAPPMQLTKSWKKVKGKVPFDRGSIDEFVVRWRREMGNVVSLRLWLETEMNVQKIPSWTVGSLTLKPPAGEDVSFLAQKTITGSGFEKGCDFFVGNVVVYLVTVHTGCQLAADTDGDVTIQLIGSHGRSKLTPLQVSVDGNWLLFQRGAKDTFHISSEKELGKIEQVLVTHQGGMAPGWFLEKIIVENASGQKYHFLNYSWVETGIKRQLPLKCTTPQIYEVVISTSDSRNGGADGEVMIKLEGEKSMSSERQLRECADDEHQHTHLKSKSRAELFAIGSNDVFYIESADLGNLSGMSLKHNNRRKGCCWIVASVMVSCGSKSWKSVQEYKMTRKTDCVAVALVACGSSSAPSSENNLSTKITPRPYSSKHPPPLNIKSPSTTNMSVSSVKSPPTLNTNSMNVNSINNANTNNNNNISSRILSWMTDGRRKSFLDADNLSQSSSPAPPTPPPELPQPTSARETIGRILGFGGPSSARGHRPVPLNVNSANTLLDSRKQDFEEDNFNAVSRHRSPTIDPAFLRQNSAQSNDDSWSPAVKMASAFMQLVTPSGKVSQSFNFSDWADGNGDKNKSVSPLPQTDSRTPPMMLRASSNTQSQLRLLVAKNRLVRSPSEVGSMRGDDSRGDDMESVYTAKTPDERLLRLHIHTGQSLNLGSSVSVAVELVGDEGESGLQVLSRPVDRMKVPFKENQIDTFLLKPTRSVGTILQQLRVVFNCVEPDARWNLLKVIVVHSDRSFTAFEYNGWLDRKNPAAVMGPKCGEDFVVTIKVLRAKRGATMLPTLQPSVFVEFNGIDGDSGKLELKGRNKSKLFEAGSCETFKFNSPGVVGELDNIVVSLGKFPGSVSAEISSIAVTTLTGDFIAFAPDGDGILDATTKQITFKRIDENDFYKYPELKEGRSQLNQTSDMEDSTIEDVLDDNDSSTTSEANSNSSHSESEEDSFEKSLEISVNSSSNKTSNKNSGSNNIRRKRSGNTKDSFAASDSESDDDSSWGSLN